MYQSLFAVPEHNDKTRLEFLYIYREIYKGLSLGNEGVLHLTKQLIAPDKLDMFPITIRIYQSPELSSAYLGDPYIFAHWVSYMRHSYLMLSSNSIPYITLNSLIRMYINNSTYL